MSRAKMDKQRKRQVTFSGAYLVVALVTMWVLHAAVLRSTEPSEVAYSEFLATLRAGRVAQVELRQNEIVAELKPEDGKPPPKHPALISATRLPGIDETLLLEELEDRQVKFTGKISPTW